MGMIRVSDEVESRLKAISDGRSMSATVERLLAAGAPDGVLSSVRSELPSKEYFDQRFDDLEERIRRAAGEY